jgi:predicted Fe-Mo cluster-binding NifX family protein
VKIAVASNNGETVAQHFGRVRRFVVLTIADGRVTGREIREATGPHGSDRAEHGGGCEQAIAAIADCDAVVVGGMGRGAYLHCRDAGVEAVLTDARRVDEAAERFVRGELPNLEDRLHTGHGHHD